jgi:hydrogenase maturation protease
MTTLVIGLGNPILTDDGAGIYAVRMVQQALPPDADVEVVELAVGGLGLMETMIGYDRAIIVDSVWAPKEQVGQVIQFDAGHLAETMNSASAHDADLPTALRVGRDLGAFLPADKNIQIVGVTAREVLEFGAEPTPPVAAAVPEAAAVVFDLLDCPPTLDVRTLSPADCWRL